MNLVTDAIKYKLNEAPLILDYRFLSKNGPDCRCGLRYVIPKKKLGNGISTLSFKLDYHASGVKGTGGRFDDNSEVCSFDEGLGFCKRISG